MSLRLSEKLLRFLSCLKDRAQSALLTQGVEAGAPTGSQARNPAGSDFPNSRVSAQITERDLREAGTQPGDAVSFNKCSPTNVNVQMNDFPDGAGSGEQPPVIILPIPPTPR